MMGGFQPVLRLLASAWLAFGGYAAQAPGASGMGVQQLDHKSAAGPELSTIITRNLQADACDETEGLYVDSDISDLGIGIGGCYSLSGVELSGYPSYTQNDGDFVDGAGLIFVSGDASAVSSIDDFLGEFYWSVGVLEVSTNMTDFRTVCTATGAPASATSGPIDSSLSGTWKCSAFEDGVTNYMAGDFDEVECGCKGDDGWLTTGYLVAIIVVAVAILVALCCCCWRYRARRAVKKEGATKTAPEEANEYVAA